MFKSRSLHVLLSLVVLFFGTGEISLQTAVFGNTGELKVVTARSEQYSASLIANTALREEVELKEPCVSRIPLRVQRKFGSSAPFAADAHSAAHLSFRFGFGIFLSIPKTRILHLSKSLKNLILIQTLF